MNMRRCACCTWPTVNDGTPFVLCMICRHDQNVTRTSGSSLTVEDHHNTSRTNYHTNYMAAVQRGDTDADIQAKFAAAE